MEYREFRDDPHLPEDAGEYADDLREILDRIPIGWGKWISCDKGWYSIIVDTNRKLRYMHPDYEIHQIKEKFGALRYYWGIKGEDPEWSALPDSECNTIFDIMMDISAAADNKSAYICEICGGFGRTRDRRGWYKTLCKTCAIENNYPLEDWEKRD